MTGVVSAYDSSGFVYVKPSAPVTILGRVESELLAFTPHERRTFRLVKAGPELTDADIVAHPTSCLGGASLR